MGLDAFRLVRLLVLLRYARDLAKDIYAIMTRPPDVIGSVFKRVPWPFFAALPMERLWLRARAGEAGWGRRYSAGAGCQVFPVFTSTMGRARAST